MSIATDLQTAMETLTTKYLAAVATPKPNYSIDGQSVSWADYLKMLRDGIRETAELLGTFDPVEQRSVIL